MSQKNISALRNWMLLFYAILCPGQLQLIVTVCRQIRSDQRCVRLYYRLISNVIYKDKPLHSFTCGVYDCFHMSSEAVRCPDHQLVDLQRLSRSYTSFLSVCVSVCHFETRHHTFKMAAAPRTSGFTVSRQLKLLFTTK